jgi:L,D-transpeptidase ErfK/SrfK
MTSTSLRSGRKSTVRIVEAAIICALVVARPLSALAEDANPPVSRQVSGGEFEYTARPGDTVLKISARYGETASVLAVANGLKLDSKLVPGSLLRVNNQHVVPFGAAQTIIINVPQRMLFHFEGEALSGAYPVAVGQPTWPTPLGDFTVATLRRYPVWHVPLSIQREMREQGRRVRTVVPPGPNNPLGDYWIGLSILNLGIHATNVAISIYGYRTHGCIRLNTADAKKLFNSVEIGEPGEVIYQPILFAVLPDGRVFLEANLDIYDRGKHGLPYARALANAEHIGKLINWARAGEVIGAVEGIARNVTIERGSGDGE